MLFSIFHSTAGSPRAAVPDAFYAVIVAVSVLGLFAAQPLIGQLGQEFHLGMASSLVGMVPLAGYAMGMFFLVPLVDVFGSRPVILATLTVLACSSAIAALAHGAFLFLLALMGIGLGSSAIQMLVPLAASRVPEAARGRTIGNIMSGLMIGIMLSRPAAGMIAGVAGWRWFYGSLTIVIVTLTLLVSPTLERTRSVAGGSYLRIIASLPSLLQRERVLRHRALHQALLMGAFNTYWTSIGLLLGGPLFRLDSVEIGIFTLAGAGGAISAPLAGRMADRGGARMLTIAAPLIVIGAVLGSGLAVLLAARTSVVGHKLALVLLCACAVVLDAGVIADQTVGRRAVNLLDPATRGRLNGLYTGLFFIGGAAGSAAAGPLWFLSGWTGVSISCALTATIVALLAIFARH